MAKKNRKIKLTVFGCVEGDREQLFLTFLVELYQPREHNINPTFEHSSGGNPDKIVGMALKNCDRNKSFAWFDEDFEPQHPLGNEIRKTLAKCWHITDKQTEKFYACPLKNLQSHYNRANRNPTLIVSQPICVESLIIGALGYELPYKHYDSAQRNKQIKTLKNTLAGIIGQNDPMEYYRSKLTKNYLEEKRKNIPELDLLISMITK